MKNPQWAAVVTVTLLAVSFSTTLFSAENKRSIEDRLSKMERLVNNKGLVDIMVRVEGLQSELQQLVGEIELQKHTLVGIKNRQRDLYLDIDRRLLQIERRSGTSDQSSSELEPKLDTDITNEANENNVATVDSSEPVIVLKTNPSQSTSSVAKSTDTNNEQKAYQAAFDLLRALRYEKATQAFREFLINYPNGRYAHIAQYWLAETSYHTRKYDIAVNDYQSLIIKYPKSPKLADALLKIGYSQFELKAFSKAKTVLNKLVKTYPRTTEAGQAENLLQKIRLQKTP